MRIARHDFVPEGGTLTVRYLAVNFGAENELEIRADAHGVDVNIQCVLSYEDARSLIDLLTNASRHHARLKNYGEPMFGGEIPCVVEYEDRTKQANEE